MAKKLFFSLVLILAASCNNSKPELNIMSYNIRTDTQEDGENSWTYRKDVAAEIIKINNIDIVGMQEVLFNQLEDLRERLPEYDFVGVGREDGKEKGEYSAIFYKKDNFQKIESGNFWLSETPEVVGSKGWDAACERIATWAILKHKKSNKDVFFINTHLDHIGENARNNGVNLILEKIEKLHKNKPIIITGDFNSTPESTLIPKITADSIYYDSREIADKISGYNGTFHRYGKILLDDRNIIDYIFVDNKAKVLYYETITEKLNNIYLSDHSPIIAKIKLIN